MPRYREQILGMAAVECDIILVSPDRASSFTSYGYHILNQLLICRFYRVVLMKNYSTSFINPKVLERADNDILNYYLFKHFEPSWFKDHAEAEVVEIAGKLENIYLVFNLFAIIN